jgi:hypothetical protein
MWTKESVLRGRENRLPSYFTPNRMHMNRLLAESFVVENGNSGRNETVRSGGVGR